MLVAVEWSIYSTNEQREPWLHIGSTVLTGPSAQSTTRNELRLTVKPDCDLENDIQLIINCSVCLLGEAACAQPSPNQAFKRSLSLRAKPPLNGCLLEGVSVIELATNINGNTEYNVFSPPSLTFFHVAGMLNCFDVVTHGTIYVC